MDRPPNPRGSYLRGVLIAAAFFALGLLAAGLLARREDAPASSGSVATASAPGAAGTEQHAAPVLLFQDAGLDAGSPRILFDPDSIVLLPDASLHLELPSGFDAGSAPSLSSPP